MGHHRGPPSFPARGHENQIADWEAQQLTADERAVIDELRIDPRITDYLLVEMLAAYRLSRRDEARIHYHKQPAGEGGQGCGDRKPQ